MNLFEEVPIGTVLYAPHEHYYHLPGVAYPLKEYVVKKEIVTDHYEHGYKEIITIDGATPHYWQRKHFGKSVFFTEEEAIEEARRLSDKEDNYSWNRGEKVRRPFEREENDNK